MAQIGLHCGGQQDRVEKRHGAKSPLREAGQAESSGGGEERGRAGGEPSRAHIAPAPASPEVWCSYSPQGAGRSVSWPEAHLPFKSASSRQPAAGGCGHCSCPWRPGSSPKLPRPHPAPQHFLLRASFSVLLGTERQVMRSGRSEQGPLGPR